MSSIEGKLPKEHVTEHAVQNVLTCVGAALVAGTHTARKHKHKSVCEVAAAPIFLSPVAVLLLQQREVPLHLGVTPHSPPSWNNSWNLSPIRREWEGSHPPLVWWGERKKQVSLLSFPLCLLQHKSPFFWTGKLFVCASTSHFHTLCKRRGFTRVSVLWKPCVSKIETVHKDKQLSLILMASRLSKGEFYPSRQTIAQYLLALQWTERCLCWSDTHKLVIVDQVKKDSFGQQHDPSFHLKICYRAEKTPHNLKAKT